MTEAERLMGDVRRFREQLTMDWQDVDQHALTDKERAATRLHLTLLLDDVVSLLKRLNGPDEPNRHD